MTRVVASADFGDIGQVADVEVVFLTGADIVALPQNARDLRFGLQMSPQR